MTDPSAPPPRPDASPRLHLRRHSGAWRLATGAVGFLLLLGGGAAVLTRSDGGTTVGDTASSAASAPSSAPATTADLAARARPAPAVAPDPAPELQDLLNRRAAAIQAQDGAAALALVSSRSLRDLEQQRVLAGNLDELPITRWTYTVGPEVVGDPALVQRLRERAGADAVVRRVDLTYRFGRFDPADVESERAMAFVQDGGRWLVAAEENTGAFLDPWDVTPLQSARGDGVLVLSASTTFTAGSLVGTTEAAVSSVTEVWGRDWGQAVVVIVPASQDQFGTLLRRDPDRYDNLAAVATAELSGDSFASAANRVWVNPGAWGKVAADGKAIVLRHEVTHVATGAAVPGDFPIWLEEGLAEYVGYLGSGVPVRVIARDLLTQARSGSVPDALPTRDDFAPASPTLDVAYEHAWWACQLIVDRYGEQALLEVYRLALQQDDQSRAADLALRQVLGISEKEFVKQWRASIRDAV